MKKTFELSCLYMLVLAIFFIRCSESTNTSNTTSTVDSLNVNKLTTNFTKKELYKELVTRMQKQSKSTVADTIPGNTELASFSNKLLYEEVYGVHGNDDRKNLYEVKDKGLLKDAMSAACIIYKSQLVLNADGSYIIKPIAKFKDRYRVCDNEPFANEFVSAFCSGFAVGKNTFITAGHCLDSLKIKEVAIVFGYVINYANNINPIIQANDIYFPEEIIDIAPKKNSAINDDYCVIRVDRDIPPFRFAKIRKEGTVLDKDSVHVIGYPCGLQIKPG